MKVFFQAKKWTWKMAAVAVLCGLLMSYCFAEVWFRANPSGYYEENKLAYAGTTYFEIRNGTVHLVYGDKKDFLGSYSRINGKWIWASGTFDERDTKVWLKPSLFGIKFADQTGTHVFAMQKRFFFRPPAD